MLGAGNTPRRAVSSWLICHPYSLSIMLQVIYLVLSSNHILTQWSSELHHGISICLARYLVCFSVVASERLHSSEITSNAASQPTSASQP